MQRALLVLLALIVAAMLAYLCWKWLMTGG